MLTVFFLFSCSKDSVSVSAGISAITGKWNIINDSGFAGVAMSNHPVNYNGQKGDYFDFRADGYIYTKEADVLTTLPYTVISDTTMVIGSFSGTSYITNLTNHTVTITAPVLATPGGVFGRKVQLSR